MKSHLRRLHEGELLLVILRGMSLVLSLVLFFLFVEVRPFLINSLLLVGIVIIYTILRIVYPFYWYSKGRAFLVITAFDVTFCCLLPFVTGGLHSPFILYPLTAILSVAIVSYQKIAYTIATFVGLSVICSELLFHYIYGETVFLPIQVHIALLAVYVIVGYLVAWIPFIANLNLSTTIKQQAIITERSRLSRELHDGLAQRLSGLVMQFELLKQMIGNYSNPDIVKQLDRIRDNLQESRVEIRNTIDLLRISLKENTNILPTLTEYTQEFARSTGIDCQLYIADGRAEVQPLATIELLKVVQEALNNVKKHSGANLVEVRFESKAETVHVIIRDNGRGFVHNPTAHHHGLAIMKERAESLGGACEIMSTPGRGTEIHVTIPVAGNRVY